MKYKFRYYKGVKYVAPGGAAPEGFTRCGHCRRAWDDSRSTDLTPAPSGRCPFEYWHRPDKPRSRNELIEGARKHLDDETYASEARVRRAFVALRGLILAGSTADRAHEKISKEHKLTAYEKGRLTSYYYEWSALR